MKVDGRGIRRQITLWCLFREDPHSDLWTSKIRRSLVMARDSSAGCTLMATTDRRDSAKPSALCHQQVHLSCNATANAFLDTVYLLLGKVLSSPLKHESMVYPSGAMPASFYSGWCEADQHSHCWNLTLALVLLHGRSIGGHEGCAGWPRHHCRDCRQLGLTHHSSLVTVRAAALSPSNALAMAGRTLYIF